MDQNSYMYETLQKGIKKGVEKEIKKAVKQTELNSKIEIAKNLIGLESENAFIIKAIGLTVEQIEILRDNMQ